MNKRFYLLDAFRGVGSLLVVIRHTGPFWGFSIDRNYLALDVFFLMSGFVIANNYGARLLDGSMKPSTFNAIRWARLYPMFFLTLALCLVEQYYKVNYYKQDLNDPGGFGFLSGFILPLFMLPANFLAGQLLFPMNGPFWSLYLEMYTNVLYSFARKIRGNGLLLACAIISMLYLCYAAAVNGHLDIGFGGGALSLTTGFARASFGISMGALIFDNRHRFDKWTSKIRYPQISIVIIVLILLSPMTGALDPIIDVVSVGLVIPVCVIVASTAVTKRFNRFYDMLGEISYPIYLLHIPVALPFIILLKDHIVAPWAGVMFMVFLSTLSWFLVKYFEKPVRRRLSIWLKLPRRSEQQLPQAGVPVPS